jgi:hypothetical protein
VYTSTVVNHEVYYFQFTPSTLDEQSPFIDAIDFEYIVNIEQSEPLTDININSIITDYNAFSGIVAETSSTYASGDTTIDVVHPIGFNVGDLILIVQSQSPLTYGQFEFNTITNISGSLVTLDTPLVNTYTYTNESTAERYQVVQIPRHRNITISSGAELSTHAYDPVLGGGILVLYAENDIQINGGLLTMYGKGYRGGYNDRPGQNGWASEHMSGAHGMVGEGYAGKYIANWDSFSHNSSNTHHMYSRSSNYGGGGGGGGGTLGRGWDGVSGGQGGTHSHNTGETDTTLLENTLLTFGGGGGTGGTHDTGGLIQAGDGGGIVVLIAGNTIHLNGGSIDVRGEDAIRSVGGWHGGSGGGAGGCIMNVTNNIDGSSTTFDVSGGNGSTSKDGGHRGSNGSSGVTINVTADIFN